MEPVSGADRLIVILRQKLQERSRASRGGQTARRGPREKPVTGLDALAAIGDVDERQLRRAFIQTLLAEQFGTNLVNDGEFQQVVTRVTEAMEQDADTARMLQKFIVDLRAS